MIVGTGNDLIDIRRIERALERFGERFIRRCFTLEEITLAESRRNSGNHINTYAKRFAAKEACAKALGTGFSNGVFMHDIGVVNDTLGRPVLHLTGGALERLKAITPAGMTAHMHITMTDEPPHAAVQVMIEAV
jgi:holo-[acyl-carrier protein] synthase